MLCEFSYRAPERRASLHDLLSELAGNAAFRLLAGGTDLIVDIRAGLTKPAYLVDVKKVKDYHQIAYDAKEGLSIGAAARCIDVINSDDVRQHYPLIAEAAHQIGSLQIRNRATLMGNLCTASPSCDMGPALLCLEAEVELASKRGTRRVPLHQFFKGVKKTAIEPDEVAERIIVPSSMADARGSIEKLKRIRGHDLALAGVALLKKGDRLRVAVGACAPTPVILREFSLSASPSEVQEEALRAIHPIDDLRASKDYREAMVRTFIARLMERVN